MPTWLFDNLYLLEPECSSQEIEIFSLICKLLHEIDDPFNLKNDIKKMIRRDPLIQKKIAKILQKRIKQIIEKDLEIK